jgi:hypothetical protein
MNSASAFFVDTVGNFSRFKMRAEELLELLRARPFSPLRITMSDGVTYDIKHPDNVIVLRQRIDIGLSPDPVSGVVERVAHCSLLHIVRVETVPSQAVES